MWTEITRPKYERDLLRYASDLTDGEWKVLEPLLPRAKSLSNGVITLDADKLITKVNDASARILNRDEADLLGREATAVFGNSNPWISKSIDYVAQSGTNDFHIDVDLLQPNGDSLSVNLTTSPLLSMDGIPIGYTLVLDDISREKRVRSTMARYMAKEVVDQVLAAGEDALTASVHEATVLFSDIRGFATISENLGTHQTVAMLNHYFEEMDGSNFRQWRHPR